MKKILSVLAVVVLAGGGYYFYTNYFSDSILQQEDEGDNQSIVYETDADAPQDCSSYEKYDPERKVCSYECTDENECSQIQKQIDDELDTWTDSLEKDKEPVAEKQISNDSQAEASYSVNTGEKIALKNGKDSAEYRKIWDDIAALSPDALSDKYIETYEIFNSPSDDTLAFVDDEDQNGKWRVAVNLAGHKSSTEQEQKTTLIHELGHIISLNSAQVNSNISAESCKNFYLDEGCANSDSYINNFKNKFWKGVTKQDYDENKFVTDYATTNEVEDLAESFAFFVLGKKENADTEKQEKINFFYNYPDLVSIRDSMRAALAHNIVRARKLAN